MKINLHLNTLQLKHPFTISRGTRTEIPSLIVEFTNGEIAGFGEATANPYYNTTTEDFKKEILSKRHELENIPFEKPELVWNKFYSLFPNNMFIVCALDEAYTDYYCKINNLKVYEYWNLSIHSIPKSNFTIGIDSIDNMLKKMREVPWPIYKIKLGTNEDLRIVTELRKHSNAMFRIDANCGWKPNETIKNAIELKKLHVEFIEQPLPAEDLEGANYVFKNSVLPIIADESCIIEEDIDTCNGLFHGVNVKLMKCGGLTPAKRMIEKANKLNLKTMVGCMTETSVGISAIAHLTPMLDYVDMDGALLIKNDIANGVTLEKGTIKFSDENGTGCSLK